MESSDSSAWANFNSAGSNDTISVSSSTSGSASNGLSITTEDSGRINSRTPNHKTLKTYGLVKSFKRRARWRIFESSIRYSGDAATPPHQPLAKAFDATPNYLKATSSSKGKKAQPQASPRHSESSFISSDQSSSHCSPFKSVSSHKSLQTLSRSSSLRNVKILIKKASFRPKRPLLKRSQVSENESVDRPTCSSTLKDSKFPNHVELHPGGTESEKISTVRVCRYHHCSLNGKCHESHDRPKRFLSRKKRSLKKQKSITLKTESGIGTKGKKKNLQIKTTIPDVDDLEVKGGGGSVVSFQVGDQDGLIPSVEIYPKQKRWLLANQDPDLIELAFGETSYPEESYRSTLSHIEKYSWLERYITEPKSEVNGYCEKCSCTKIDKAIQVLDDVGLSDTYPLVLSTEKSDKHVSTFGESCATLELKSSENEAPVEDTMSRPREDGEINDLEISSASDRTSKNSYSGREGEFPAVGDSETSNVLGVDDSENGPAFLKGFKPKFSKERHISMWYMIHQHMASGLAAEAVNKPLQGGDGENQIDGSFEPTAAESPDANTGKTEAVSQDIEVRKLLAIKLVREAIEKILLPEVQDQASDNQSTTNEDIPEQEPPSEKTQTQDGSEENSAGHKPHEGEGNAPNGSEKAGITARDISRSEMVKAENKAGSRSDRKAPKHWSNLKKWILLQRFVKELEKVKKFNPRKANLLPLNPEPESEKVNLKHQTADERKRAEEWMLDYALQQAVSQLAPSQKRKVALLVKAFETVVPTQEDCNKIITPRLKDETQGFTTSTDTKEDEYASEGNGKYKEADGKVAAEPDKQSGKSVDYGLSLVSRLPKDIGWVSDDMMKSVPKELYEDGKSMQVGDDTTGSSVSTENLTGADNPCSKSEKPDALNGVYSEPLITSERSTNDVDQDSTGHTALGCLKTYSEERETLLQHVEPGEIQGETTLKSVDFLLNKREMEPEDPDENCVLSSSGDQNEVPDRTSLQGGAKSDPKGNGEQSTELDRQNYIRMWHMVYQHVVSGIAEKVGSQLLYGTDDDEAEDCDQINEIHSGISSSDFSDSNNGKRDAKYPKSGFNKTEAVKLVKEAVDEIILPEIQDDFSDAQSVTIDLSPDQEISENNQSEGAKHKLLNSSGEYSSVKCNQNDGEKPLNQEKGGSMVNIIGAKANRGESPVSKNYGPPKPKNWSKLKKLLLLKRSIRALEKARQFTNPHPKKLQSPTSDPKPDKVDLRRQMMDERKKAEQWMLDYAVQHIVTKLTPARKRRVAMLVEAFEAVVPLPEI